MSHTYTYKELMDEYVMWYMARKRWHEDFRVYYDQLMPALEQLFGVCLLDEDQRTVKTRLTNENHARNLWRLIDEAAEFLHESNVGDGWLIGGPYATLLELRAENPQANEVRTLWADAGQQFRMAQRTYREMIYEVFVLLFGRLEKVVTSADLLALGVDDSRKPDLDDYW